MYNGTDRRAPFPLSAVRRVRVRSKRSGAVRDFEVDVFENGILNGPDPLIASPAIRAKSILHATTNSSGQVLLANGLAGQLGNLAPNLITGPRLFST
jgi:hypothetical protein